jgi:hypothetical protein
VLEAAGLPPVQRASIHEKYIHKDTPTREQVVDAFTSFLDEYGYMPPKIDYSDFYRESRKLFKSDKELIEACGLNPDNRSMWIKSRYSLCKYRRRTTETYPHTN